MSLFIVVNTISCRNLLNCTWCNYMGKNLNAVSKRLMIKKNVWISKIEAWIRRSWLFCINLHEVLMKTCKDYEKSFIASMKNYTSKSKTLFSNSTVVSMKNNYFFLILKLSKVSIWLKNDTWILIWIYGRFFFTHN